MSQVLPLYLSRGIDRPMHFYAELKHASLALASFFFGSIRGENAPDPDPHHKLPTMRPSRDFWGVREDTTSAAKIAAPAKSAGPAPAKDAKKPEAKGKGGLSALRRALADAFADVKKILASPDDDDEGGEFIGFYARRPEIATVTNGALDRKLDPK